MGNINPILVKIGVLLCLIAKKMAAMFENKATLFYGTLGFHRVKDTLLTRTTNIFMVVGGGGVGGGDAKMGVEEQLFSPQ